MHLICFALHETTFTAFEILIPFKITTRTHIQLINITYVNAAAAATIVASAYQVNVNISISARAKHLTAN